MPSDVMNKGIRRRPLIGIVQAVARIGAAPDDPEDVRLQKALLVIVAVIVGQAGLLWGGIYLYYEEPLAASIPLGYAVSSLVSVGLFGLTRHLPLFRFIQLSMILLLPFLLMVALGGFVNGSAVILWSLLAPIGALVFTGRQQAVAWFLAFVGLIALGGALEPVMRSSNNLPPLVITVFFVMNIAAISAVAFLLLQYYLGQKTTALALLDRERERSERLLLNILPGEIAAVLKDDVRTIADHFDSVSVLFADAVDFTPLSAGLAPQEMVALLDEVFSYFDSLSERYGLEKIRTIGDSYMVVSGVPRPRPDHAKALARMALDMNEYVRWRLNQGGTPIQFRIGMNSGPVVAGVIGRKKFQYDLWGDTVNTASRMESHGVPGKIQLTRATYDLIKEEYVCQPRGLIEVKGKGTMETWFLDGLRAEPGMTADLLRGARQ